MFSNSDYIRENLLQRMELFELPILESGDLILKAFAFKFSIVLLLCYDVLFYLNLYSSLAVANGYSICSWYWQAKPSSVIFLNACIWFVKKNWKNCFLFLAGLNFDFHGLKKKKNHKFTFTFSDIVSIHPSLFLSSFV